MEHHDTDISVPAGGDAWLRRASCYPKRQASDACWLDRLADAELQHGHHARAEALAARAAEMRMSHL